MKTPPPLSLLDYERIFQVIYSVLEASGVASKHHACIIFTTAGARILREHYKLPATISFGFMGIMVDEKNLHVLSYGRLGNGPESDREAFHAWIECQGWLIDFMAPIMGRAYEEVGYKLDLPRRMLQKPLDEGKPKLNELKRVGDFYLEHNPALAESLIESRSSRTIEATKICLAWFRHPPEALEEATIIDISRKQIRKLVLHAPSIEGAW